MKRPLFAITIGSLIGIVGGLYFKQSIALLFVFFFRILDNGRTIAR